MIDFRILINNTSEYKGQEESLVSVFAFGE